jgi:hypothetical protein
MQTAVSIYLLVVAAAAAAAAAAAGAVINLQPLPKCNCSVTHPFAKLYTHSATFE